MSDPLSLTASILTVLQLSTTVTKYLKDLKGSSGDRRRLCDEIRGCVCLLEMLKDRIEDAEDGSKWCRAIAPLASLHGPLDQFKQALELLASKLASNARFKQRMTWPFDKAEITTTLNAIERHKSYFNLALQDHHIELTQQIQKDLSGLADGVSTVIAIQQFREQKHRDQESQDIIAWISPLNFARKQVDFFSRQQEGTGQWFLEDPRFKKWLDEGGETLWCPGLPGAGKTTLASIVINSMEKSLTPDNISLAYIYCIYKEKDEQTDVNLISSIVQQLLQRRGFVSDQVSLLYNHHVKRQTRPSLAEWSDLLNYEVRQHSKTYIIIDALDECSEGTRDTLLDGIRQLPNTNLLVTSRPNLTIEHDFEGAASIEIRASEEDVRKYLKCRIPKERRLLRHVKEDPALLNTIINTIVERSKGMFLLVQLHMNSLAKKHNRRDIRLALKSLPKELDATYADAMKRIKDQDEYDAQLAEKTLYWISFAARPLTVQEIQHALAVTSEDRDLDSEALPHQDILVSVCAGLVTIDQESSIIRLVHYTTQEYFERVRQTLFPYAQMSIATYCLQYISFDIFSEGYCSSDQELETRMRKYALLEYAAQNWGAHAQGDPEEVIKELSLNLFANNSKLMCSNQIMHLPGYRYPNYSQIFPKQVTGLHIAASFGLARIAQLLLEQTYIDVDSKDSNGRTPLSWASENGQEKVVQLLISHKDVTVDVRDNDGRTPLSFAAGNGYKAVVQLLLDHNAHPDSKDNDERTPLSCAAENGHADVVHFLLGLDRCVDANSKDHVYGRTPLSWAAEMGHDEVVRLLLHHGVEPDLADIAYGQTPLMWAAEKGHVEVVRALLEHEGVDFDSADETGESALITATRNGYDEVVQLLLEYKGVDVGPKDDNTTMLLSWAKEKGPKAVSQMLKDCDTADSSSSHNRHDQATLLTGTDDRESSVRQLLQRSRIHCDSTESHFRALLLWAVKSGHESVARILIERKEVRQEFVDNLYGRTLLSWAAQRGYTDLMQLLLDNGGTNVNSKDNCGQSPLSLAAHGGHEGAVRLLLTCEDIDTNSKDRLGGTPLSYAGGFGHKAVVKLLMECKDVDVDMGDNYNETALSWAAEAGHTAVVELLLSSERVTADSKSIYYRTPLSLAAGNGHEKIVQLFLKRGDVDVNTKDNHGRTALMWAMGNGRDAVVRLLEDYQHLTAEK